MTKRKPTLAQVGRWTRNPWGKVKWRGKNYLELGYWAPGTSDGGSRNLPEVEDWLDPYWDPVTRDRVARYLSRRAFVGPIASGFLQSVPALLRLVRNAGQNLHLA